MDVLADVLSVTGPGTAVVARAELVPPWGLVIDPLAEAHVHVVQKGRCWLRTSADDAPVQLNAGDVVLIGAGVGHCITDSLRTKPAPHQEVLRAMPRRLATLPASRAGETTVVLCAKYLFQSVGPHPLTSLLPPLVHVRAPEAERHGALQLLLQLIEKEARSLASGSEIVIPRLVDSLLVFVLRAWLDGHPLKRAGWFGALRDPAVARALSLIHQQPAAAWSVAGLARKVAQSRATFARRFARLVGESPLAYVTRWRMCLANKLLAESDAPLDDIASRVGYQTASALSKAFRRVHGRAPGAVRAEAQGRQRPARARRPAAVRRRDAGT